MVKWIAEGWPCGGGLWWFRLFMTYWLLLHWSAVHLDKSGSLSGGLFYKVGPRWYNHVLGCKVGEDAWLGGSDLFI